MKLVKSSSSILRKFLIFNLFAFLILGLFTFFYLRGIQPSLVDQRTEKHIVIINNTSNHIERLNLDFKEESLNNFLLFITVDFAFSITFESGAFSEKRSANAISCSFLSLLFIFFIQADLLLPIFLKVED